MSSTNPEREIIKKFDITALLSQYASTALRVPSPSLWLFTAKDYVGLCNKKQLYSKKRRQKDKETKYFRKEKDQNDLEFGAQSIGSSSFPKTSHDEPLTLPLLKFHNISSLRHDFRSFHCYTGVGEKQKLLKFCDQTNCIRSIHTSKSRLNF